MQNKKAVVEDLESRLKALKDDLTAAFDRQGTIEGQIRAGKKANERLNKSEFKYTV